jgi:hypothetical protein
MSYESLVKVPAESTVRVSPLFVRPFSLRERGDKTGARSALHQLKTHNSKLKTLYAKRG